jgi:hypothetical protein
MESFSNKVEGFVLDKFLRLRYETMAKGYELRVRIKAKE